VSPGGQTPVQRGLRIQVSRDRRGRHSQRTEKAAHRGGWRHRLRGGVETAEVHVQVAVGKLVRVVMGPPQCQPGLAHATPAGDHCDYGAPARVEQAIEHGEFAGSAVEQGR
jgi:hypothetical protein